MGWHWRQRRRFGPIGVNYGRRGIGASIGIPGIRFGQTADGRRYVTLGFPGLGLYYTKYFGRGVRKLSPATAANPRRSSSPTPVAAPTPVAPPTPAPSRWWVRKSP